MNKPDKRSQIADHFDLAEGGHRGEESVRMGRARHERRLRAKKQNWIQMVHEELMKDRHHILAQNHDNIRKVAAHVPGLSLVMAWVDCEPALAKGLGNEEAGHHYLKWRQS
jgi:hypothetical protein